MKVGLISAKRESLPLGPNGETQNILTLTKFQQSFTFKYPTNGPIQNSSPPTPSLLRDFSAPVKLNFERNEKDLLLLMKYDSNLLSTIKVTFMGAPCFPPSATIAGGPTPSPPCQILLSVRTHLKFSCLPLRH